MELFEKKCIYCGKIIKSTAINCTYCGEFQIDVKVPKAHECPGTLGWDAEVYYRLANKNENENDIEQAIYNYQKAIKIYPRHAFAYNNLALIYTKLGQYENAVNCFKHALAIDPKYALSYFNLGATYSRTGDTENSIPCLIKAARLGDEEAQQLCIQLNLSW